MSQGGLILAMLGCGVLLIAAAGLFRLTDAVSRQATRKSISTMTRTTQLGV